MTTNFSRSHQRSHFLLGESQGDSAWASQISLSFARWYSLLSGYVTGELILLSLSPPGPNIWSLLLLYLPTQLPLAPSSWSTNWSDSLLSEKRLSTLHPPLPLQRLWPPFPRLGIPQFFFFHHPSDFVSDADTELSVPAIMVWLSLPYPHHLPYNKQHYLSSSTWRHRPSFPLLWYYTQIRSQPCWQPFFPLALSSLSSTLMGPNDHRKDRRQRDDGKRARRQKNSKMLRVPDAEKWARFRKEMDTDKIKMTQSTTSSFFLGQIQDWKTQWHQWTRLDICNRIILRNALLVTCSVQLETGGLQVR